ncbi:MFS transporter [Streptomyces sp. NPDC048518]|uniref:MFS transporter n=1 Tax=Streptomyces sp. NPDC048518 TaxID=3155029 RepID=UPI0033F9331E
MSENETLQNRRIAQNDTSPTNAADPRRWAALVVVLVASFMDAVDVTVVHIALPDIQAETGASTAQVQWITGGYALAFALGLITGGRLGDLFGRKKVFLLGVVGFTLTSLVCGVAGNPEVLLAGRVAQGAMAALMVPQVLSIIHVTFPERERGKVFGIYGSVMALGTLAGPLVGALLVEGDLFGLGWRPIFLVNLPLGAAGLIAGALLISESKAARAARLDLAGVVLATAGLLTLVLPLTQGRELGWPAWTYGSMAASVLLLTAFVAWERRLARRGGSPLVVLSLFSRRGFAGGQGVQLLFGLASGVFFLAWTLYLQLGLGFSPLKAGLSGMPLSAAMMAGAGLSMQVLVPRFGRGVLQAGGLLAAAGMVLFVALANHYGTDIAVWQTMMPLIPMGLGMGMIIAPLTDIILSDVPHEYAGSASGLTNTTLQLGQAIGVALSSVVFFDRLGPGDPTTQAHRMPHAFAGSLWYVAAAFTAAFVVLFALPRDGGRTGTATDPAAPEQQPQAEPVSVG